MISVCRLAITKLCSLQIGVLILVMLSGISFQAKAQCSNARLGSFSTSPLQLRTYAELQSGGTAQRYAVVQVTSNNPTNCPRWRLTVRATDNFKNGNTEVDLRNTSIRFNTTSGSPTGSQIGISGAPFTLSKNETTIISQSNTPLNSGTYPYFEIKYDLIIAGGNHLMTGVNGDYRTNLVFTLRDEHGNTVSTTTTNVEFQIYYDLNNNSNVQLLNGANNVSLSFNNASDYANGVTNTIANGLSVTTYAAHQIMVKAATGILVAPGNTQHTIPVSAINLTLNTDAAHSRVTCYSVPLSSSGQLVANNPLSDYTYQTVLYTLQFKIAGNTPSISSAPHGTYSTSIVFIIVPK